MSLIDQSIKNKARNNHSLVVDEIGKAIVSGELPEGTLLPGDSELSKRFGVSRTVLREAMKTLAAKRLVEAKSKVGTRVLDRLVWNFFDPDVLNWRIEAGFDADFVRELGEIRLILEPPAAAAAAKRSSSDEIVELYTIVARFDDMSHTAYSFAKADLEFHQAISRMSGNIFMVSLNSLIEAALFMALRLSSPTLSKEGIKEAHDNHLKIVHAIAAHDEEKATDAMRQVIELGIYRITQTIEKSGRQLII